VFSKLSVFVLTIRALIHLELRESK